MTDELTPPLNAEGFDTPIRWHEQALVYYPGNGYAWNLDGDFEVGDLEYLAPSLLDRQILRARLVNAVAVLDATGGSDGST